MSTCCNPAVAGTPTARGTSDRESARVTRHLAIPKDMPGALTSDVVVTEDAVLYNCCASGVIAQVDLSTGGGIQTIRVDGILRNVPKGLPFQSAVHNLHSLGPAIPSTANEILGCQKEHL